MGARRTLDADVEELESENQRLRQALDEAREELRRRDEFLSIVAHELRNPISPLVFTTNFLLKQARSGRLPDQPSLLRHLTLLRGQLDRLKEDLTRLLDFSRFRSGRVDLDIQRVDLVEVVTDAIAEMKPQLEAACCELRLTAPDRLDGDWDRLRLRQIAWNLLSNAARFGASAPIEVLVAAEDHTAQLRVTDHGPGVPEHERARIFSRFEQLSTNQPHTGFGVGLWVVKRIVDAFGGTIALESAPGGGTSFSVTLPRRSHGG